MPGDPLRRLKAGDPIPTSKRTWNPILDNARNANRGTSQRGRRRSESLPMIQNNTGNPLPRYSILELDGPLFDSGGIQARFDNSYDFKGKTPTANAKNIVVLIEPAQVDGFAEFELDGLVQVDVDVLHADHTFAKAKESTANLESATTGWPIVWKPTGTGVKRCYVNLSLRYVMEWTAKPDVDIVAGATEDCEIWIAGAPTGMIEPATLDWMHKGKQIDEDMEIVIRFDDIENAYKIRHAEC